MCYLSYEGTPLPSSHPILLVGGIPYICIYMKKWPQENQAPCIRYQTNPKRGAREARDVNVGKELRW